ncbi:hypothetical protein KP22_18350 [Pectobacterium betavasculorum]|uniref:DUF2441 domain-containing protein n=1 Tax=Pectobacterium betavasculorum TaxID=55207 RepID=A0A093RI59_9GAMM|nr:hypothetical protein KP22_18350 [Pectobacterium betavasculorum]
MRYAHFVPKHFEECSIFKSTIFIRELILKNTYYHINILSPDVTQWSVGEIITFEGYNNYYNKIIELIDYAHGPNKTNIHIDTVLNNSGYSIDDKLTVTKQREKYKYFKRREIAFESIRKKFFSKRPSRISCIYLAQSEHDIKEWANFILNDAPDYRILIVEPINTSNIFITGDQPLWECSQSMSDIELSLKARQYWSEDSMNGNIEVLVSGGVKVLSVSS